MAAGTCFDSKHPRAPACRGINPRGAGYVFGSDICAQYCHRNNVKMMARAHQLAMEGYKFMFDEQLVTVWSAPNYCYRHASAAASTGGRSRHACWRGVLSEGDVLNQVRQRGLHHGNRRELRDGIQGLPPSLGFGRPETVSGPPRYSLHEFAMRTISWGRITCVGAHIARRSSRPRPPSTAPPPSASGSRTTSSEARLTGLANPVANPFDSIAISTGFSHGVGQPNSELRDEIVF
jgi:hypothetical protein